MSPFECYNCFEEEEGKLFCVPTRFSVILFVCFRGTTQINNTQVTEKNTQPEP